MTGRLEGSMTRAGGLPENYLSDEIAILQSQRRAAISSCDFGKIRVLDCHIDRLKEEMAATKARSSKIESDLVLDVKRESVRAKAEQKLQEARDSVLALQSAYNERLIQLHTAHGDELALLGERYAKALELAASRGNPVAAHLKFQAQFNAQQRNYEMADGLLEEAEEVRRQHIERNQGEITRVFEEQRSRIVDHHGKEIALCKAKLLRDIRAIQMNYQKELATVKHSLAKTATDLNKTLNEANFDFLNEFVLTEIAKIPSSKTDSGQSPPRPLRVKIPRITPRI
jgi:hypothetical protein